MHTKRIIPCLDVNAGRVVKGVNFVNLIDAGDPVEIAKAYDKAGADEVVFLDITASSDARETVVDMVRKVAAQVFIPFTVGGGIRTVNDFEYEKSIADVNRKLSGIETFILFTEPEHTHISSSIVRELLRYGKDISLFVPKETELF